MPFDSGETPTIAAQMRVVLGPNGEHWWKGGLYHSAEGDVKVCLLGAFMTATEYAGDRRALLAAARHTKTCGLRVARTDAYSMLNATVPKGGSSIPYWNDHIATWRDICALLDEYEAKELAAREPA